MNLPNTTNREWYEVSVFGFLDDTNEGPLSESPWDQILYASENFVVVPTRGALVKGWLLVVPKQPFLCVGALSDSLRQELEETKELVASIVHDRFGEVAFFEHGPSQKGHQVGCGVDHAHLHVVPTECPLLVGAKKVSDLQWTEVEGLRAAVGYFQHSAPYLYVEQSGSSYMAPAQDAPSQLFRRVIASHIGSPESFNWRDDPKRENVIATVDELAGRFPSPLVGSGGLSE